MALRKGPIYAPLDLVGELAALEKVYKAFEPGSDGFVQAVQAECGFGIGRDEIQRIARAAENAADFMRVFDTEEWWREDNRPTG